LNQYLTNSTLAAEVYASPFSVVPLYPVGTPEREGIIRAYNESQRYLCITGVCLCVPLLLAALVMRNPRLEDKQSIATAVNRTSSVWYFVCQLRLIGTLQLTVDPRPTRLTTARIRSSDGVAVVDRGAQSSRAT